MARVLLAGGTGAVGRPVLPLLIAAGHQVTATTRSPARVEQLRAAGAEPVVVDAFDSATLRAAVTAARPDVVVHQLTALATPAQDYGSWLADTNRLRAEVTPVLVDAARDAGARRVVAQSASFTTAPRGPWLLDEDAPLDTDAPGALRGHVQANLALERAVLGTDGVDGVVLRYGFLYGPGTGFAPGGGFAEAVRTGRQPIVGDGEGRYPFVHVDDAAAVTVAAVERGAPGVYNVVDDDPAPMREWVPFLARLLGGPEPSVVPADVAEREIGPQAVYYGTRLRGASNARARRELGMHLRYPSWREGFRAVFGAA
ncbi:Nucleoside-diphosphate-sugar epimerase [Geodermatophilus saharensis]|uniref:Nucleoside-diphosphate-sugar epimerase n=1 Tax=Geodermatophilus saharensis TaxID=1137994 RepID=A0A239E5V7_9ACTN|nr:NAD-dependent epimerase/dehydratase family protein [Geodermatophilus saharensis]SNS39821.1 Nucleoside-diphosphate-sugar epimerase [Geodermatophilus saharensis]